MIDGKFKIMGEQQLTLFNEKHIKRKNNLMSKEKIQKNYEK